MTHINTVYQHLLDQLESLKTASTPEAIRLELERAKGVSELAQVCTNMAKVQVDYLRATNQEESDFFDESSDTPRLSHQKDGLPNGISSMTRHRVK